VRWIRKEPSGWRFFDDLSRIHNSDPVGSSSDNSEIMRDEKDRHSATRSQAIQHFQNLRLHGDVERSGGLVRYENFGLGRQGNGDHDALPHSTTQLVGISPEPCGRIGDADLPQELQRTLAGLGSGHPEVRQNSFHDLVAYGEDRIQAGHGILKDHPDSATAYLPELLATKPENVGVAQPDGTTRLDPPRRGYQL
jgi:hypothetical protein